MTRERDDPAAASVSSEDQLSITRFNEWYVPAYCFYNAEGTAMGQVKVIQEDLYRAAGTNAIPFVMKIYHDQSYSTEYTIASPVMILGEPVYVMVTAQITLSNFQVVATDCWATRTSDPEGESYAIQVSTLVFVSNFQEP